MSRFLNAKYAGLTAYTPGEQPRDRQYIKLNTNESPYPPAPAVLAALGAEDVADLRLYSDPEGTVLREKLAGLYGVKPGQVFLSNGSDDILNFAFMAFGADGAVFPSLTYSFYPVFADLHQVAYETVPLKEDFSVDATALAGRGKLTVLANPNAPTGLALPLDQVEAIVAADPSHVVVVDEAYVDFGAESAAALLDQYDNLLVVMTYSKSRSKAGARLGFALGSAPLVSYHYGAGNREELHNLFAMSLRLMAGAGIVLTLAAEGASAQLVGAFASYDPELYQLTLRGFRLYSLAFLCMGMNLWGSAFFTALNNGAVSAAMLEEVIARGARKVVLFGSCGSLCRELPDGHLIVPTAAYRDEGVSYHYLPAEDYISLPTAPRTAEILRELGVPFALGRTWTTDALYRETRRNVARRKAEGCIAVDMECASLAAVCRFRGVAFHQFLYTEDNLDGAFWDPRLMGKLPQDAKEAYFRIALEIARRI